MTMHKKKSFNSSSLFPESFQNFLRGFAWNHAAKISEYFLLYVFSVIVARSLGPATNGVYVTLVSISQLLLTFSSVALDIAINRFLPQIMEPNKEAKTAYLLRRLIVLKLVLFFVCSVLFFFGWDTVQHWFDIQSAATLYVIFIIALGLARAISSSLTSVWISRLESKIVFIINTGTLILQIAAASISINNGYGLNALLIIILLGSLASTLAYVFVSRKFIATSTEKIPMKPVFSFTGWLWVNAITTYVYGKQGDIMMLSFFSINKSLVGCYDAAYTLSFLPSLAFAAGLGGISMSMFSRIAKEQPQEMAKFWTRLSSLLTQITVPIYCFLALFAGNIVTLLYSSEYVQSVQLLQVFIIARIISRLFSGGESFDALLSVNAEHAAVKIGMIGSLVNVVLNLVLIPQLQVLGAVLATSITTIAIDSSTWMLLRRRLAVQLLLNNWIRSLLVGVVPVIAMKLIFPAPSMFQLMLSAAFCILVWVSGILVFFRRNESSSSEHQQK